MPRDSEAKGTIDFVISENKKVVMDIGMPYCDTPVYPEQKEISLRCGFLPHFIIGFKVENEFYVNPAVFTSIDKMHAMESFKDLCKYRRHLMSYGLEVDQAGFEEFCKQTNYKRYYSYNGVKYNIYCLR